ncbi:MAG: hypothetical protein K6E91_10400 [Butyrivibrio sp.]|nr:hypothetical protein [Butyrivibrio sp.]
MRRTIRKYLALSIAGAYILTHPVISHAETVQYEGGTVTYEQNEHGTTDITFSKDGGWTNEGTELEFKYSDGSQFIINDYVRQDNGDITVTTYGDFDINQLIVEFKGDPPAVNNANDNTAPAQDNQVISNAPAQDNQVTSNVLSQDNQSANSPPAPAQDSSRNSTGPSNANETALFVVNNDQDSQVNNGSNSGNESSESGSDSSAGAPSDAFSPAGMSYEALNSDARRAAESQMSYSSFTALCQRAISSVGSGQTLTINTGKWMSIDRKTMEAIAARPDMTVTINYIYNEKAYSVTIPAGYDVMSLLDENGFCGFLYLNKVFGAKEQ